VHKYFSDAVDTSTFFSLTFFGKKTFKVSKIWGGGYISSWIRIYNLQRLGVVPLVGIADYAD
jgi:hypothetical protein